MKKKEISKSNGKDIEYYLDLNNLDLYKLHSTIPRTRALAELSLLADELYELNKEHTENAEEENEE